MIVPRAKVTLFSGLSLSGTLSFHFVRVASTVFITHKQNLYHRQKMSSENASDDALKGEILEKTA